MNGKPKITFGIITDGTVQHRVADIVKSIVRQCSVEDTQIVVVGGGDSIIYALHNVIRVPFVAEKPGWITRKKNLITSHASHDVIVYLHDYIKLHDGWYSGFCKFCDELPDWDVMMNRINNKDGSRYRDWVIWDDPDYAGFPQTALPPYNYNKTQFMYVSGAYWIAKKSVMIDLPLNEKLFWNQGEDVEWSKQMREKYNYMFNPYSEVDMLKYKDVVSRGCY